MRRRLGWPHSCAQQVPEKLPVAACRPTLGNRLGFLSRLDEGVPVTLVSAPPRTIAPQEKSPRDSIHGMR